MDSPSIWRFLGAVEDNGKPSSTRIHAIWWSLVSTGLIVSVFWHMIHLADPARLAMWLSNLPMITLALLALQQGGYLINQGSGVAGMLADAWGKRGKPEDKPQAQ